MEAAQSMPVKLQTRTDASVGQTFPQGGRPIRSLLRGGGCGRKGVGEVERRKNLLQILPTPPKWSPTSSPASLLSSPLPLLLGAGGLL